MTMKSPNDSTVADDAGKEDGQPPNVQDNCPNANELEAGKPLSGSNGEDVSESASTASDTTFTELYSKVSCALEAKRQHIQGITEVAMRELSLVRRAYAIMLIAAALFVIFSLSVLALINIALGAWIISYGFGIPATALILIVLNGIGLVACGVTAAGAARCISLRKTVGAIRGF